MNGTKPDFCLYRDDVIENFKKREVDSKRTNESSKNINYVTDFAHSDVWGEVKKDDYDDPFNDPPESKDDENVPAPLPNQRKFKVVKEFLKTKHGKVNKTVGQFAAYATTTLTRQYRTHCFSIGVFGSKARFFRWDRAGVVVSRAFDYRKTPFLREFAKRYCQATEAQRGYDMSVCKATEEEEKIFKEKIEEHVIELYGEDGLDFVEKVAKHYQEAKVFKVKVLPQSPKDLGDPFAITDELEVTESELTKEEDKSYLLKLQQKYGGDKAPIKEDIVFNDVAEAHIALERIKRTIGVKGCLKKERNSACHRYTGRYQYFLISRPVTAPPSVAGRATRGYWSVKIPDESAGDQPGDYRICFLKDTWRTVTDDMDTEGDIMVELFEAGVEFVSDILCHGDIGLSEDESSGCSSEYIHVHHIPLPFMLLICYRQDHKTKTDGYVLEAWNSNREEYKNNKHIHYRMVSAEVGCPLSELVGAYELFEATRMAFVGE